ncbi:hypothetical protein NE237_024001 [Protea cynaroides]|uniref:Uncharacterized protein n=1 Tax=Protea cynaroides TaxID=273540 RepID=A0A9Q0HHA3_9MAGN|nr:hypothetical protein NE237_024001 [Protea cynaroides]
MKVFGVSMLLVVVGAALVFLSFTSSSTSSFSDLKFASHQDIEIVTAGRKLKENTYNMHTTEMNRDMGNVNLEDYYPIDPSPSSRATITTGPIEHGTPLMPHIPKPGPPSDPSSTESP